MKHPQQMRFEASAGPGGRPSDLAVLLRKGGSPGFVWLGGWRSDMTGTKAVALDEWCGRKGLACTRFDYSGHGASAGDYRDGTISQWLHEALAVFGRFCEGPQVVVGSSMGGWIALRLAQELRRRGEAQRLAGMLLIAPAPDFTRELMEPNLTAGQKQALAEKGRFEEPSEYGGEPNTWTRAFIEDGAENLVMGGRIDTHCPVRILQGVKDPDVPHSHALKLAALMPAEMVTLTSVPDGDHRLSRPQDIETMLRLCGQLAGLRE
jgi:pimeloyl-ACP methyl ester carboxylesterase